MTFLEPLRHGVVATHIEPNLIDGDGFGLHVLIVAQAGEKSRHKGFHHKRPILSEMGGDVLETAHLVVLIIVLGLQAVQVSGLRVRVRRWVRPTTVQKEAITKHDSTCCGIHDGSSITGNGDIFPVWRPGHGIDDR